MVRGRAPVPTGDSFVHNRNTRQQRRIPPGVVILDTNLLWYILATTGSPAAIAR
ncbi:MAG: hypothetical protein PWP65_1455 [Clostridia bacterium]|nr:hypothetical protein [Clostridia bacterium]